LDLTPLYYVTIKIEIPSNVAIEEKVIQKMNNILYSIGLGSNISREPINIPVKNIDIYPKTNPTIGPASNSKELLFLKVLLFW